jgi:hypothetical protein
MLPDAQLSCEGERLVEVGQVATLAVREASQDGGDGAFNVRSLGPIEVENLQIAEATGLVCLEEEMVR